MRAGKLRHKVEVQSLVETRDPDTGERVKSWAHYTFLWANVEQLKGKDFFANKQAGADIIAKIRVRYREDITTDFRMLYGGKIYALEPPIDPDGRKRELLIMAKGWKDGQD